MRIFISYKDVAEFFAQYFNEKASKCGGLVAVATVIGGIAAISQLLNNRTERLEREAQERADEEIRRRRFLEHGVVLSIDELKREEPTKEVIKKNVEIMRQPPVRPPRWRRP